MLARGIAVVLAVSLTGALGVGGALGQPKSEPVQPRSKDQQSMDQQKSMEMNADKRVEGTIKSVDGSTITLEDGTRLAIPSSVMVSRAQLKPGAMIVAEYQERGGQKVATSVQIKG